MIKPLRKRHLQIWIALAMLIPLGIISAVLVRPQLPKDKLLQPAATAALPVILKSVDKDDYTVRIRSNSDTSQLQLEWINKKILMYPTATIYQTSPNPSKGGAYESFKSNDAELIGRIEARGTYHFELKKNSVDTFHFILYDFIHKKIINTITF